MRRTIFAIALAGLALLIPSATASEMPADAMTVYFLDMNGGGSTLIVTPLGESVLIDTGSLEPMHRDAERIHRAAKDAGLKRIDHLITTHFHSDHYGGLLQLTKQIPVKRFYDKGALPPEHEQRSKSFQKLYPLYQEATGERVQTIAAGDEFALENDSAGELPKLSMHCVAAENRVAGFSGDIDAPISGFEMKSPDLSDNGRSIAMVLRYGDFDLFLGGDITWNVEHHLAHPKSVVGPVDVYQVTHHGLDQSNNPVLVQALAPTVCIAMNGPRKGIQPRSFLTFNQLASLQGLYQIHYNTQYGDQGNPAPQFIANGAGTPGGQWIKVVVSPGTGTYSVFLGDQTDGSRYRIK